MDKNGREAIAARIESRDYEGLATPEEIKEIADAVREGSRESLDAAQILYQRLQSRYLNAEGASGAVTMIHPKLTELQFDIMGATA